MPTPSHKAINTLILSSALTLSTSLLAETSAQNKKSYKVDFGHTETQDKQADNGSPSDTSNNTYDDKGLRILFYRGGRALLINPDSIPGANIKFQENNAIEENIQRLKEQNIEYIVCEKPSQTNRKTISTKHTVQSTSPPGNTPDKLTRDKLTHLQSLGYNCNTP